MAPNEYQKLAERTSATRNKCHNPPGFPMDANYLNVYKEIRLLHAAMGLCTEAGEFQDQLKCYMFYGKELDPINLAEEIGDIFWYCAEACNALGINFEDVMEKNIAKLKARYPDKFTSEQALNRDLDAERKMLED